MGETTHLVLGGEVLPTTHPPTHEPAQLAEPKALITMIAAEQLSVDQFDWCMMLLTTKDLPPEPSNMSEAMASSEAVHWKAAADEEFKSL